MAALAEEKLGKGLEALGHTVLGGSQPVPLGLVGSEFQYLTRNKAGDLGAAQRGWTKSVPTMKFLFVCISGGIIPGFVRWCRI